MIVRSRHSSTGNPQATEILFEFDEEQAARNLGQALRFPTVSHRQQDKIEPAPFLDLHQYLADAFPKVHQTLHRETFNDLSLLFTWRGRDSSQKPILLMSHLDIVGVPEQTRDHWCASPFGGEIVDNFVYGRGALDVKSGFMSMLEAFEILVASGFRPNRTIYLACGHDEEVGGGNGNAVIAQHFRDDKIRFDYVLDEGGALTDGVISGVSRPVALIAIAEKTSINVELVVSNQGGHSSAPGGNTAIGILASAIQKLECHSFTAKLEEPTHRMLDYLGPELPWLKRLVMANRWAFSGLIKKELARTVSGNAVIRTTAATTMVHGGIKENMLPDEARARINLRLLPSDSLDWVLDRIRDVVGDPRVDLRPLDHVPHQTKRVSSIDAKGFQALLKSIGQVFPDAIIAPCLAIHSTDSRHYMDLGRDIYRYLPMRVTPKDLQRIHGTNERISIADYANMIRFFISLMHATD